MQLRAQASLSGQASSSNARLPSLLPRRSACNASKQRLQPLLKNRRVVVVRASQDEKSGLGAVVDKVKDALPKLEDVVDENILEYCSLDKLTGGRPKAKRSLGEKEAEFLDALRAFYYDEKPILSNEEFDVLKDELLWAGSKIAVLSSTEQKFLEASQAYQAGKSIVSDEEYDQLKAQLRKKNSVVVQQGPRCSIRSRRLYSDASPDYLKMTLLNLPAAILTLLVLFSIDDLTGFEITYLVELPDPWGLIVVWGFVLPFTYIISSSLTNLVLKDFLILKGPCPNCGQPAQTYFGDIFTVKGSREENEVQCGNCKAKINFNAENRSMVIYDLPGSSSGPPKKSEKQPSAA